MKRLTFILLALGACVDVEQTADQVLPENFQFGHYWQCDFEIQYGYPEIISVESQHFHPCLYPGDAQRDAYINAWVADVCFPKIDAAEAAGNSAGGGNCGGPGCDPQNFDICTNPVSP